jgi:purine-binding chemotaxis protein CheW
MAANAGQRMLLVTAGERRCALPLVNLSETMRPLRSEPLPGAPEFVLGLALVRGAAAPVVDLAKLLGCGQDSPAPRRFVLLTVAERALLLAVTDVLGIQSVALSSLHEFPALIKSVRSEFVTALVVRDTQLWLVLESFLLVPEAIWPELEAGRRPR